MADDDDYYSNPTKFLAALQAANPYLPRPELPSLSDIKKKAALMSKAIFKDWNELHHILDLHEETIRKRWMKKNVRQRQTILQAAYPAIPSQHRPDFRALEHESFNQRRNGSQFRDIYLLPELNLEDLSKPRNLLILLNSRGRNLPDVFSHYDFEKVELGRTGQAIVPSFINEYTMYLTGQKDAEGYGRIVGWDENDDAFHDMMYGIGLQPGEGIITLEAQQKMLSFLLKCANSIIHDLPLDGPPVPEPPPFEDSLVELELSSIAAYATGTSFRIPIQFDIYYLKQLAQTRVDQAQDHIWSLREDPSYFREVALDFSEHRLENLVTAQGARHPKLNTSAFWEEVFLSVITGAYGSAAFWTILKRQLDALEVLRDKHEISTNRPLLEEYDKSLGLLQHFLTQLIKAPIIDLKKGAFGSPPLRRYFFRLPQDPHTTTITACSRPVAQLPNQPKIIPLINRLFDEEQCALMGRHNVLDEIDRVLRTEKRESDCVTPWILNQLAEMSIVSEFLRQLDFHQPRIGFNYDVEKEEQSQWFENITKPVATFFTPVTSQGHLGVANLGTPKPGRFVYPIHKKLTEVTVGQIRKAEAELDAFWAKADSVMKSRIGITINEKLKEYIGERKVERMPEWVEIKLPTTDSKASPTNQPPAGESTLDVKDQFALLNLERRTEATVQQDVLKTVRKEKVKTRGIASPNIHDPSSGATIPTQALSKSSATPVPGATLTPILVPRRAYETFTRVFYIPSADRIPREVSWSDFLHAMTSAGCSAKRLMGSAWIFSSTKHFSSDAGAGPNAELGSTRSIIFHEPHPAANIPFNHLRKHGRRLSRRWGWSISKFAVGS
ncbi:hypothetical protein DFJ43DRAFT_1023459 [Lentinula guzmanii]|uniref:Uncharacterized protein n=1 Tax=Lentinula guzmanii TaxID=2804957 RepID=A0AA38JND7_9AGAR|nr:hypothetical protein DFJ43DRAFT_1023459 [Lentinula guzmanii]